MKIFNRSAVRDEGLGRDHAVAAPSTGELVPLAAVTGSLNRNMAAAVSAHAEPGFKRDALRLLGACTTNMARALGIATDAAIACSVDNPALLCPEGGKCLAESGMIFPIMYFTADPDWRFTVVLAHGSNAFWCSGGRLIDSAERPVCITRLQS